MAGLRQAAQAPPEPMSRRIVTSRRAPFHPNPEAFRINGYSLAVHIAYIIEIPITGSRNRIELLVFCIAKVKPNYRYRRRSSTAGPVHTTSESGLGQYFLIEYLILIN